MGGFAMSVPYQGVGAILRTGSPAPAAPAAAAAPVAPAASDNCGCPSALDLQLKVFDDSNSGAGLRHITLSETPKPGVYWRVLQVDAVDTDSNLQYLTFFLTPPGFTDTTATFPVATPDFFLNLRNTIRLGIGHNNGSNSDLTTVASNANSPTSETEMCPIIVPPGWRLGVVETNNIVSGSTHHLILRVLLVEVSVNVPIFD